MGRKLKTYWSCSDIVHHAHHTKLGAFLCGRFQYLMLIAKERIKYVYRQFMDRYSIR
jgi:hypothetical protein